MKNRALMPLFLVMLFDTAGYTIRFPVLTLVFYDSATRLFPTTTSLVQRSMWYGVCMALYWIGAIIAAPLLSSWSDYAGRKKALLLGGIGTLIFALSTALGVFWGLLSLVLLGALIGGLCSRMDPIAQATVGDVCVAENKVLYMSYLQLFISVGAFIGPIIGGYFAQRFWFPQLNFSLPFLFAAFFAVIGLFIIVTAFRETGQHVQIAAAQKFLSMKAVLRNKKVQKISLLLILIQLSWSMYYQFIAPILKKQFHFVGTEIGFFMGAIALWLALASAFGIKLLQPILSLKKIIQYASWAMLLGIIGTLIVTLLPQLYWARSLTWIFAIPIAAGDVITYSAITALYSDAVTPTTQGQVMGTSFILVSIVWALTALLGGWLIPMHIAAPLWFSLIGVGILIFSFVFKNKPLLDFH